MFKIEKNVPVAKVSTKAGIFRKYPFNEMEVGDSFSTGPEDFGPNGRNSRAGFAAAQHGRRFGMKFATRREGEGFRIWRIA